jgi:hypothetical protein
MSEAKCGATAPGYRFAHPGYEITRRGASRSGRQLHKVLVDLSAQRSAQIVRIRVPQHPERARRSHHDQGFGLPRIYRSIEMYGEPLQKPLLRLKMPVRLLHRAAASID